MFSVKKYVKFKYTLGVLCVYVQFCTVLYCMCSAVPFCTVCVVLYRSVQYVQCCTPSHKSLRDPFLLLTSVWLWWLPNVRTAYILRKLAAQKVPEGRRENGDVIDRIFFPKQEQQVRTAAHCLRCAQCLQN